MECDTGSGYGDSDMLLGIRVDQGRSGGIALCHYEVWYWELETNHVIKAATR